MRHAWPLLAVLALTVLAGCGTAPSTICPVVGVLDAASQVTKFSAGAALAPENVTWQAEITGADLSCEYTSDTLDEMEVNLQIDMVGYRGPAAPGDEVQLRYFVVITDRTGTVVTKKEFPATIEFGGRAQASLREDIWQLYRLNTGGGGSLFEVWVGFQLSDEEVEFNRATQG